MAPRQLSPQEMVKYSNVLVELANDPAYRPYIAPLIAKKFPEHATAFSDVAVANRFAQFEQRQAKKEMEREAKEFAKAMEDQRKDLVKSGRYTEDQTKDIKTVMDRYGITDYAAGAVLYSHEHQPVVPDVPEPKVAPSATWEFPSPEGRDGKPIPFGDFVKNPTAAAMNAAYRVISEFKTSRLPAGLHR